MGHDCTCTVSWYIKNQDFKMIILPSTVRLTVSWVLVRGLVLLLLPKKYTIQLRLDKLPQPNISKIYGKSNQHLFQNVSIHLLEKRTQLSLTAAIVLRCEHLLRHGGNRVRVKRPCIGGLFGTICDVAVRVVATIFEAPPAEVTVARAALDCESWQNQRKRLRSVGIAA